MAGCEGHPSVTSTLGALAVPPETPGTRCQSPHWGLGRDTWQRAEFQKQGAPPQALEAWLSVGAFRTPAFP